MKKVRKIPPNSVKTSTAAAADAIFFSPNPGDFPGENETFSPETTLFKYKRVNFFN